MASRERSPRGYAGAPRGLGVEWGVADHGGEPGRRAAKMTQRQFNQARIGLSPENLVAASNGVDQIVDVHQAPIAFQFVALTIRGKRDAGTVRLDRGENPAHAGKRLHPRQIERAIALALRGQYLLS